MNGQTIASVLNELLATDPKATNEFFGLGVYVNDKLASHPSLPVRGGSPIPNAPCVLTPLGLLNGLLSDGTVLVMRVDGLDGQIAGFDVMPMVEVT